MTHRPTLWTLLRELTYRRTCRVPVEVWALDFGPNYVAMCNPTGRRVEALTGVIVPPFAAGVVYTTPDVTKLVAYAWADGRVLADFGKEHDITQCLRVELGQTEEQEALLC
jgi:hypothetical protein